MSKTVALADVAAQLDHYGPLATLVTVGPGGAPHVGTVLVTVAGDGLAFQVGPTTRGHVLANPAVSLAWLADGDDYQLIVDGDARVADEPAAGGLYPAVVSVRNGIRHRLAGRVDGPSCRAIGH
ncbi:MAG: pyridoxamine 5'-phosphate oxidase family protein [Ilumatobacteraceae bacterium]